MNFNNTLTVSSVSHEHTLPTNSLLITDSSDLANGHLPKNQLQLTQTGFNWINTARKYRAKKLFWAKFERTPAFPDSPCYSKCYRHIVGNVCLTAFANLCSTERKRKPEKKIIRIRGIFSHFFFQITSFNEQAMKFSRTCTDPGVSSCDA